MEETADFFNDSAVSLAAEGCHTEAIACLRRGLQLEPYNSLMWFNLGLSYYALNEKDNARHALYQAVRCDPFDADIWDTLGVVLHETGEIDASRLAYTKALELEVENGRIWNNYGTRKNMIKRAVHLNPHWHLLPNPKIRSSIFAILIRCWAISGWLKNVLT